MCADVGRDSVEDVVGVVSGSAACRTMDQAHTRRSKGRAKIKVSLSALFDFNQLAWKWYVQG